MKVKRLPKYVLVFGSWGSQECLSETESYPLNPRPVGVRGREKRPHFNYIIALVIF